MATVAKLRKRDMVHSVMVTIEVDDPPLDRLAWQVGFAIVRFGFWLMGLAGVKLEVRDYT